MKNLNRRFLNLVRLNTVRAEATCFFSPTASPFLVLHPLKYCICTYESAAKVITDRQTGRSKGFAFVTYSSIEEAEKAKEGMNGKFLDGWVIFVDPAKPREYRPPPPAQQESSDSGFKVNKTIGWCG